MPVWSDSISAMPIMPMLPANEVSSVRAFLVIRLFSESDSAVRKDIDVFPLWRALFFASLPARFSSERRFSSADGS